MAKLPFFLPAMKKILPFGFRYGSGAGWRYTWHLDEDDKDHFHFECNECLYHHIFGDRGLMKLGAMFCHSDVINFGNLPYTDFKRTKTLCQGGDCCDFDFVRHAADAGERLGKEREHMKYAGMPFGMWLLFRPSFKHGLMADLGLESDAAAAVARQAKAKYREIIASLPVFEKGDRFKMNIISCAMLSAFLLSLPKKPSVDQTADYYRNAMMIGPMRWFCRMGGKRKFAPKDVEGMKRTAALKAADRNPYSWNMTFHPYPDSSGYEARFTRCGICTLMKKLGLFDYVPAMCALDYAMSEAGGTTDFVRKYTLASGGPYCDCGYKRKV